ncbi:hypothetical protein LXL04_034997 [Taraxacum kok-saghyz]
MNNRAKIWTENVKFFILWGHFGFFMSKDLNLSRIRSFFKIISFWTKIIFYGNFWVQNCNIMRVDHICKVICGFMSYRDQQLNRNRPEPTLKSELKIVNRWNQNRSDYKISGPVLVSIQWGTRAMRRRQFYSANGFVLGNRLTSNFFSKGWLVVYPHNIALTTYFRKKQRNSEIRGKMQYRGDATALICKKN